MGGDYHEPVLRREAIEGLSLKADGTYVDATLGGGGYTEAIASKLTTGKVFAFDTDPHALDYASRRLTAFGERVVIVPENFRELRTALSARGVEMIDGIVYDLGVSSHQLDTASIGLSYRVDAPLDMRLDPRLTRNAKDFVNTLAVGELASIFRRYGEEPLAGRIARRIDEARKEEPIERTTQLATIVSEGIREDKRNTVLSRIFQALRIAVNGELESLEQSLRSAVDITANGGRIVVISYHSLEDRIVKELFREESAPRSEEGSVISLRSAIDFERARLKLVTKKPVVPTSEEIQRNVRARSAKMRIAEKV